VSEQEARSRGETNVSERLTVADICTRAVAFAHRSTSVVDAARLMREHHVGTLVVVDETEAGRVVVGMLTDRDIVASVVAKDLDPGMVQVGDAMSADPVCAHEENSIIELLGNMRRKGVRRAPVVDMKGILIGLVALDDVLEVVAEELRLVVQAIESGRQREPFRRP
jgi:CBS domain-containing protein